MKFSSSAQRFVSVNRSERGDRPVRERISFWLVLLIFLALMGHLYNMTMIDADSDLAVKSHFFLLIMVGGVVARGAMAALFNYKIDLNLKVDYHRLALYLAMASMLVIGSGWLWSMTASAAPDFLAGATVAQVRIFYTLGAVAEEIFWNWGVFLVLTVILGAFSLQVFGHRLPVPPWGLALVATCVLFAVYHRAVYETSTQLWLMFLYRAAFTMSYVLSAWVTGTRDMSVAVIAHMTVNYLASG